MGLVEGSEQGPGQGWVPLKEEGHCLICTEAGAVLPGPLACPPRHSSPPTCSPLCTVRPQGPGAPPASPLEVPVPCGDPIALRTPPPGPGLRHSSALPSLCPSVTYHLDHSVTVHLFSPHKLVLHQLEPGPGLGAGDAEWTRSSSQSVDISPLQAGGHTQRAGSWSKHPWELQEPRGGTWNPEQGSSHGELLGGGAHL